MMKAYRSLILLICLTLASVAGAQSVKLKAPAQAVQGQNFRVAIEVKNIESQPPAAPAIENCTLRYGPATSTMQSFQFVNGQQSSEVVMTYTYTYVADKASTVTIPAVTVTARNGQKYTTSAAPLTILPPDASSQAASQGQAPGQPQQPGGQTISADDMFVRISLNKNTVYEQEPVVATVKLYTRHDISMFRVINQPTFEGFLSEELDVPGTVQIEHVNGKNYSTMVLKRCVIYPQKSGRLTINSGKYEVTLTATEYVSMGYFPVPQRVEKKVNTQTNTLTVDVQPLPTPKPAGFNGAVGSYTAEATLEPQQLRTGESATYTLKVTGSGNIKYLTTPELPLPPGIEQYTPQTDIDATYTGGNLSGTYTVTYTLVPQEPGDFTIPAWQFCYFDPQDKEYHTVDIQAFDIKVAKGLAVAPEQKQIATGMTDIMHIKPSVTPLVKTPEFVFHKAWYWLLYAGLALALVAVLVIYRRHLRLASDVQGRREAGANRAASRRLSKARKAMTPETADRFYAELSKALFGYLGDKLRIPASQLIRENISAELASRGIDPEATAQIIGILDECEMARFTPQHDGTEMAALYSSAIDAIKRIDKAKPARQTSQAK